VTGDEPLNPRPPRDEQTRNLIRDTALAHPGWGRIRIYEELRCKGNDVDQRDVDYVIQQISLRKRQR